MAQLFDQFGPYMGDTRLLYGMSRRQRRNQMGLLEAEVGAVAGAETAALGSGDAARTIMIGVATGLFTYLLTRVADRVLFGGHRLGQRRKRR